MKLLLTKFHFLNNLKFAIFVFVLFMGSGGCSSTVRFAGRDTIKQPSTKIFKVGQSFRGKCSFYASKFNGRRTANGEIYNMHALTAAHRTLPFNTILQVENLANGKKILVRVNDRGPFKKNRILDISLQAAKELDMIKKGTADVKVTIIKLGKSKRKK